VKGNSLTEEKLQPTIKNKLRKFHTGHEGWTLAVK